MRTLVALAIVCTASLVAAESHRTIVPEAGPKPIGPFSPGIEAGDWVFVSGQGVRTPTGDMPPTIRDQARQCLENVKAIVTAAGLTMDHIVYTQLYLKRIDDLSAVDEVYREYFHGSYPARAVIGIERLPAETTVELNAIVARDTSTRKTLPPASPGEPASAAVAANGLLFVSTVTGETDAQTEQRLRKVLKRAPLRRRGMVFVNWYSPRGVPVTALPGGASVGVTGIWSASPVRSHSACRRAGTFVACAVTAGGGTSIEAQVKDTMSRLHGALEVNGMDWAHVTAATVWLNDLADFTRMNKVYGSFYGGTPPARTTVQSAPSSTAAPLVRISLFAVE